MIASLILPASLPEFPHHVEYLNVRVTPDAELWVTYYRDLYMPWSGDTICDSRPNHSQRTHWIDHQSKETWPIFNKMSSLIISPMVTLRNITSKEERYNYREIGILPNHALVEMSIRELLEDIEKVLDNV